MNINFFLDRCKIIKKDFTIYSKNSNLINKYLNKVIVINLESNNIKRKYIKFLLDKLKINFELLIITKIPNELYDLFLSKTNILISKNDLMDILSFLLALRCAIKSKFNEFMILKDNCYFHKKFHFFMNDILNENQHSYLIWGNKLNKTIKTFAFLGRDYSAKKIFKNIPILVKQKKINEIFLDEKKLCKKKFIISHTNFCDTNNDINVIEFYKNQKLNISLKNYHFIYLNIFEKYFVTQNFVLNDKTSSNNYIKNLLLNYYGTNVDKYFSLIDTTFFDYKFISQILFFVKKNQIEFNEKEKYFDSNLLKNDKTLFLSYCNKNHEKIVKLPDISPKHKNECVYIIQRYHEGIKYIIKSAILKLKDNWMITIIIDNFNYKLIKNICSFNNNINIIKSDICKENLVNVLSNKIFWQLLHGEKILILNENICCFKNIDNFISDEYIFKQPNYPSLWTKKKVLDLFENYKKIFQEKTSFNIKTSVFCERYFININDLNNLNTLYRNEWIDMFNYLYYELIMLERKNLSDKEKKMVLRYPNLFHKSILNIVNINDDIKYEVINENINKNINENINKNLNQKIHEIIDTTQNKILLTHLHCYDLSKFDEYYIKYINKLTSVSHVILTYSIKYKNIENLKKNITILKIPNKGMDIGGKFCAMDYIKKQKINCKYILFLHSKKNKKFRKFWFNCLTKNIDYILNKIKKTNNIGGFFCPAIRKGNNNELLGLKKRYIDNSELNDKHSNYEFNYMYMQDMLDYFNLKFKHISIFPGGNCFVLKQDVAMKLFSDKYLYNILNTPDTFDLCWVKNLNYIKINSIYEIYNFCINNKLNKNNLKYIKNNIGFSDAMIEHTYERLIFLIIKNMNYNIELLNYTNFKFKKNLNQSLNLIYN